MKVKITQLIEERIREKALLHKEKCLSDVFENGKFWACMEIVENILPEIKELEEIP